MSASSQDAVKSEDSGGEGKDGSTKAIIAALLSNLGIALTKFVAFLLTKSSSMLEIRFPNIE